MNNLSGVMGALTPPFRYVKPVVRDAVEFVQTDYPSLCLGAVALAFAALGTGSLLSSGIVDRPLSWLSGRKVCHVKPNETWKEKENRQERVFGALLFFTLSYLFASFASEKSCLVQRIRYRHAHHLSDRMKYVKDKLGADALKLDPKNPRPKVVWLVADASADGKGLLNPIYYEMNGGLNKVNTKANLRYEELSDCRQICSALKAAEGEAGKIDDLIISGHGTSSSIHWRQDSIFSDPKAGEELTSKNLKRYLPSSCFDSLKSDAKIFLQSCSTGANVRDGFAAKLSRISGREVVAAPKPVRMRISASNDGRILPKASDFSFVSGEWEAEPMRHFCPDGRFWDEKKGFLWGLVDILNWKGYFEPRSC